MPVITVSRTPGSWGDRVAAAVAQELGHRVVGRLERIMERGDDERPGPLTREQARELLRQREREGAGYMRYLFNIDWMDPQQWDVVVNTGSLTIPQAVRLITSLVTSGDLEPTAADRQRLANLVLGSRVESAILGDASVWVNGLRVTAQSGRVRLEGEVIADEDREIVEQL